VSATDDDLNAYDGALDYDGHTLHTADPGVTGANIATGGELQAVTMGALGAAGPSPSRHPATPGRSYATAALTFDLAEVATWQGFWAGGVFRKGYPLRAPIGSSSTTVTVSIVPAVQVNAPK
jgi:hypothetical protein